MKHTSKTRTQDEIHQVNSSLAAHYFISS